MQKEEIKKIFEPRSIAVIGASHSPEKVGYKILENIITGGYKGKVFPVNPAGGEILEKKVFTNVNEIKEEVDMALVAIPAEKVYGAVLDCAKKKIRNLIILSSGFSEIGHSEEEKKIIAFAKENNIRILGPNVFGIYSAKVSLNATFGAKEVKPGNVAIISQSGALGIALMGRTQTEGIGLSSIVFEGNKSDLCEADFLPYLAEDDSTKAVFIYLEGIKDGKRFVEALKETVRRKPVVILKAGTTEKGAKAAISHTGSLSGEAKVFFDVIKQTGALPAENLSQAISWLKFLTQTPRPKGENVLIITNGGGMGILAADACEKYRLNLYEGSENLKKNYCSIIPGFGSCKNPVDITGQARVEDYQKILQTSLGDSNIDSVICLGCEIAVLDNKKLSEIFLGSYKDFKKLGKPLVFSFVGGSEVKEHLLSLKEKGVPIFPEIEEAVSCLGALYHYYHQKSSTKVVEEQALKKELLKKINKIAGLAIAEQRKILYPNESKEILRILGISFPNSFLAKNGSQAVKFAQKIGFPVAVKIVSKDIIHKTDAGGVVLDLKNNGEVLKACRTIRANCLKKYPDAIIKGYEIGEIVEGGVEVIVGARKDQGFGTIVSIGLGGIYVEIFKDIVFRLFPLSTKEAEQMIKELRSSPLFSGFRGQKKKDNLKLVQTLLTIGLVVDKCPLISEIEINPLLVFDEGRGVKALDVRTVLFTK